MRLPLSRTSSRAALLRLLSPQRVEQGSSQSAFPVPASPCPCLPALVSSPASPTPPPVSVTHPCFLPREATLLLTSSADRASRETSTVSGAGAVSASLRVGEWRRLSGPALDSPSPSPSPSHLLVHEALKRNEAPARDILRGMFVECQSGEDLGNAMKLLAQTRLGNAAVRGQLTNFSRQITDVVVNACIHVGSLDTALAVLHPRNPYGLSFSPAAARALLEHAREQKQGQVILGILRRFEMFQKPAMPYAADDIIRGLCEAECERQALGAVQQLQAQGLALKADTIDYLLVALLSKGLAGEAVLLLRLRDTVEMKPEDNDSASAEIHPQIVSALSLAHALDGNPSAALDILSSALASQQNFGPTELAQHLRSYCQALKNELGTGEAQNEDKPEGHLDAEAAVNRLLQELRALPALAEALPGDLNSFEDGSG